MIIFDSHCSKLRLSLCIAFSFMSFFSNYRVSPFIFVTSRAIFSNSVSQASKDQYQGMFSLLLAWHLIISRFLSQYNHYKRLSQSLQFLHFYTLMPKILAKSFLNGVFSEVTCQKCIECYFLFVRELRFQLAICGSIEVNAPNTFDAENIPFWGNHWYSLRKTPLRFDIIFFSCINTFFIQSFIMS